MVRASVRAIIHSLTLVDYLPVQTHKPYSNYRLIHLHSKESNFHYRIKVISVIGLLLLPLQMEFFMAILQKWSTKSTNSNYKNKRNKTQYIS